MIFLIQYDRSAAKLISMTAYEDGQREDASGAKLELEISLLGSSAVNEVVLLEAPTEEHLRKTHRRYFETLNGLKGNEKR
ncbi:MAG: hypothetical protein EOP06_06775 [Proteobacteria bacterium]|nr:MAG: hypothetical protein EOP06_06775 [Pseudomonadota bacterium]